MSKKYYTVGEVAYLYGVSKELVSKWIKEGQLKTVPVLNLHEDEQYYRGINVNNADTWGVGITEEALNEFKPNVSYKSVQILEANNRRQERDHKAYLDWLDQREQALYNEIEFISSMRNYLEKNGPYL